MVRRCQPVKGRMDASSILLDNRLTIHRHVSIRFRSSKILWGSESRYSILSNVNFFVCKSMSSCQRSFSPPTFAMKSLHLVVSAVFLFTSIASACSDLGGPCDLFIHCCGTLKCHTKGPARGVSILFIFHTCYVRLTMLQKCICAKLGEKCSDGYGARPPGCCQGLVCDQPPVSIIHGYIIRTYWPTQDNGGKCITPPNESV